MSLGTLIQDMRGTLDKMQTLSAAIRPSNAEELTVAAAIEQLRQANGGRYCSLRMEVTAYDSGRTECEWDAYTSEPPTRWPSAPTAFEAVAIAVKGLLEQATAPTAEDLADVPTAPLPEAAIPVGSEAF